MLKHLSFGKQLPGYQRRTINSIREVWHLPHEGFLMRLRSGSLFAPRKPAKIAVPLERNLDVREKGNGERKSFSIFWAKRVECALKVVLLGAQSEISRRDGQPIPRPGLRIDEATNRSK